MKRPCTCDKPNCHLCDIYHTNPKYRNLWSDKIITCIYLGQDLGEVVACPTCNGSVKLKLFSCLKYGSCTLKTSVEGTACCNGSTKNGKHIPCPSFQEKED